MNSIGILYGLIKVCSLKIFYKMHVDFFNILK
jgi:hypothetical protein